MGFCRVRDSYIINRTGSAAQIRHHVSAAFGIASSDGPDGRGGLGPMNLSANQIVGSSILSTATVSVGIGAEQAYPVLVWN